MLERKFQSVKKQFIMLQTWPVRTPRSVATKLFVSILSLFELIIIFAFIFAFLLVFLLVYCIESYFNSLK